MKNPFKKQEVEKVKFLIQIEKQLFEKTKAKKKIDKLKWEQIVAGGFSYYLKKK